MRSAIRAACLSVFFAIPASAQKGVDATEVARQAQAASWAHLETSRSQTLTVEDTSGRKTTGSLLAVAEQSLTLRVDDTVVRVDRTRVRRVTSQRRDSLRNGALAGAAIGAGMAAGSSCTIQVRRCGRGARVAFIAIGAALWAAIGASIDSSIDKRFTLYEAPPISN